MKDFTKYRSLLVCVLFIFLFFVFIIGLGNAITPLLVSFILSYLFFPVIKKLEARGILRKYAVFGSAFVFILFILSLSFLILPSLLSDLKEFASELPQNMERATRKIDHFLSDLGVESFLSDLGFNVNARKNEVKNFLIEKALLFSNDILKAFSSFFKGLLSNLLDWVLMILNLLLIPLFFFYIINDYEKISEELKSFIPLRFRDVLRPYIKECNHIFSAYIRGQLVAVFLLGILYGVGFSIVSLRFGFLIGMITGILNIVPFLGVIFGFILSLVIYLAYFTGIKTFIGIIIVFLLVKVVDDLIITPKLVGNKVGLSAFLTVLSLIIAGNLFGFIGMVFAIPAAAFLKFLILNLKKTYIQSEDSLNR